MTILAIDPGTTQSAWVHHKNGKPIAWAKEDNQIILERISSWPTALNTLAIELIRGMGMRVGSEVFDTCIWTGRFLQAWIDNGGQSPILVPRNEVKLHLCGQTRGVNDAAIRAVLIERYGPGKELAVGRKASPGPLYGMKADCWQALGLAVTVEELNNNKTKGDAG